MDHNETQPNPAAAAHAGEPKAGEPEWIVNDLGELGVRIGNRFFFCYKGESLEYDLDESSDGIALHDDGIPMLYRIIGKREFGETVWPMKWIEAGRSEDRYRQELTFTPGLSFGKKEDGTWKPLPASGGTTLEKGKAPSQAQVTGPQSNRQHAGEGKAEALSANDELVRKAKLIVEKYGSLAAFYAHLAERAPLVGRERESLD